MRAIAILALLTACGGPPPPVERPAPPPRSIGRLESLVPEDARLVVLARPAELMASEATRRVVTAVFDEAQLDGYQARTGVDPRRLEALVIAVAEGGTVVLARGVRDAEFAVEEAGERMAPLESSVEQPFPRRAGFIGARRADMAALDPHTVVWIDGTPQLAAATLAAAQRPEVERPRPLSRLVELRAELADAPFAMIAPRPLNLPIESPIGLLLAREDALGIAARPDADGALAVEALLQGEFPPDAHENFRAFAASMAESDLAAALGARDALPTLTIEVSDARVRGRVTVDPGILAAGLRAVLIAEMRELIEGPFESGNQLESND